MLKYLIFFQKKFKSYIKNRSGPHIGNGEFARRIRLRHKMIRTAHDAGIIRNTILSGADSLEKWHAGDFWQRKLDNKYNSREFAKMYNCNVPELYWKGQDINIINFDALPEQFVIRPITGHSSRGVFLMNNGINLVDKRAYSDEELREALTFQLNAKPELEFLVEEFVRTEEGAYQIPKDYKFYTFNGEIACIQIVTRPTDSAICYSSYDEHWKRMPDTYTDTKAGHKQEPPKCLEKMIEQVKRLSRAYEVFVRIDFYATDKGPVFGEFTTTPSRGNYFSLSSDKKFTRYWNKFCPGKI